MLMLPTKNTVVNYQPVTSVDWKLWGSSQSPSHSSWQRGHVSHVLLCVTYLCHMSAWCHILHSMCRMCHISPGVTQVSCVTWFAFQFVTYHILACHTSHLVGQASGGSNLSLEGACDHFDPLDQTLILLIRFWSLWSDFDHKPTAQVISIARWKSPQVF